MDQTNQLPVITISRMYGSVGRSVAKRLGEKLGLEYYDKDFGRLTAQVSGYSLEDVQREGEDISNRSKFLNILLNNTAAYISSYDEIFRAQREVLLELAKRPCIIIGRCGNVILREAGIPTFDIFLYGNLENRMKRAAELAENGNMPLEKYIERRDHLRKNYYRTYTGHELGDYNDYHLCIDTGTIGYERTVEIILDAMGRK